MSVRPVLKPSPVITNGDMSASITSAVTIIDNKSLLGYEISWSGTSPVGTMSVEVSNSYSQNADGTVRSAGTWTTLTISPAASVSGNTGNGYIDIELTTAFAVRLKYTRVSGTGTMQALVTAKVT